MLRVPGATCGFTKPCLVKDGTSALTSMVSRHPTTPAPPLSTASAFVGGTPLHEAKSLLRPCLPHGNYGKPLSILPTVLEDLIGQDVTIPAALFAKYLKKAGIRDADIGGPIHTSLPRARYLVIHDTSSPLDDKDKVPFSRRHKVFPANINDPSWPRNQIHNGQRQNDAHVFVTRIGTSYTAHDFSQPYSATKYTRPATQALKNKFCHVELIQPRLVDVHDSDWQSPNPGYPDAQIERLAVVYIAASLRHGAWLIPAYHHNVDKDFGNSAHDDPQNFNLTEWSDKLGAVLKTIHGSLPAGSFPVPDENGKSV